MARTGRPKIELDAKQAYIFGYFRATHQTMAYLSGCSTDTIRRAIQDETTEFCQQYKKGFASMAMALSEAQVKTAIEDRNATLLIWLGKQYLGQKDNVSADDDESDWELIDSWSKSDAK